MGRDTGMVCIERWDGMYREVGGWVGVCVCGLYLDGVVGGGGGD